MAELVRCTRCRGGKMVMGLGGISKKCDKCKGIGFTEMPAEFKPVSGADDIKPAEKPAKPTSRKPKPKANPKK